MHLFPRYTSTTLWNRPLTDFEIELLLEFCYAEILEAADEQYQTDREAYAESRAERRLDD